MRRDKATVKGKKWLGWWWCNNCALSHSCWEGDSPYCPYCEKTPLHFLGQTLDKEPKRWFYLTQLIRRLFKTN